MDAPNTIMERKVALLSDAFTDTCKRLDALHAGFKEVMELNEKRFVAADAIIGPFKTALESHSHLLRVLASQSFELQARIVALTGVFCALSEKSGTPAAEFLKMLDEATKEAHQAILIKVEDLDPAVSALLDMRPDMPEQ